MSLIHDALKKIEAASSAPPGKKDPAFSGLIGESVHPPSRWRLLFIGVLFLVALGFFLVTHWSERSTAPPLITGKETVPAAEAERLGSEAVEAYRAGDLETAWAKFSAAASLDQANPALLNDLGLVAKKRGDATRARELWEKALTVQPNCPACLNNLALLDRETGDRPAARTKFLKAIALNASYPEALFHLGLLAEEEGNRMAAVDYYTRFLKLAPSLPPHVIEQIRDHLLELE